MIHDLTSNSDFSDFTDFSEEIIDLLDVPIQSTDEILDFTEIVYTGTSSDREFKRLVNVFDNKCDRCGCDINIKGWEYCQDNFCTTLCEKCNQYLNEEYGNRLNFYDSDDYYYQNTRPYNFIESDNELFINNIFLWD